MLGLKRIRELERQNAALVSIITDLREALEAKEDEAASERRRRIELNERFINYKHNSIPIAKIQNATLFTSFARRI